MKSKFFLFTIILILVVSLVPLSGVSAQRTTSAPASSVSMSPAPAPAARETYSKTIKYRITKNCGGVACLSYTQKITWTYNNKWILTIDYSNKGIAYNPAWSYDGWSPLGTAGGAGKRAYYLWLAGMFSKDLGDGTWKEASLNITMQVLYDGTYWKYGWWYTYVLT
jgi:hypothetical protein